MHAPVLHKKSKKTPLNPLVVTFNRYRRKIDQLRHEIEVLKSECEQALVLYHTALKSKEKQAGDLVTQFIFKIQDLVQPPKALNKKERMAFREFLELKLNLVFALLPLSEIHEDINKMYKEIHGKSGEEKFYDEMSNLKEMFTELGFNDIDFSDFNPKDNLQDILRKLSQSILSKVEGDDELLSSLSKLKPKSRPKSKKELIKEQKARELEALQNKGLSTLYKRLVKELHPDLEQDEEKRTEKEAVMKRLTNAYNNQDLISLLELESEWLGMIEDGPKALSDDSFKMYNSLLKKQTEDLQQELDATPLHPRYLEIQKYLEESPEKPLKRIKQAMSECDDIIVEHLSTLKGISGKNPLKILKAAVAGREKMQSDHFFDDFDLFL